MNIIYAITSNKFIKASFNKLINIVFRVLVNQFDKVTSISGIKYTTFSICFLFVLTSQTFSQQGFVGNGYTDPAVEPGAPAGSYSITNIENINLATRNLSVSIPLLNIGGRGDAGYTMELPFLYNWQIKDVYHPDGSGSNWTHSYFPIETWSGFEPIKFSPGKMRMQRASDVNVPCGMIPAQNTYGKVLSRIIFIGPDGTQLEFFDKQTKGKPAYFDGCQDNPVTANRGKIWITSGSKTTFVSDNIFVEQMSPANDYAGYPSGMLNFPDGKQYRIDVGKVSYIIDRNGNKTSFQYNFETLTSITDSLGRVTTIAGDEISYKSLNGTTRKVEIGSDSLSNLLRSDQTFKSTLDLFPSLAPDVNSNDFRDPQRVSYVRLPDGKQYNFQYNSYGDVARIEFPSGFAIEYEWGGSVVYPTLIRRWLLERRVYPNGNSGANYETKTKYEIDGSVKVTQLGNTVGGDISVAVSKHFFHPILFGNRDPFEFASAEEGFEYKTENYNSDGTVLKSKIFNESEFRTTHTHIVSQPNGTYRTYYNKVDYRPIRSTSIEIENGKALATLQRTEYDDNGSSDPAYFSYLNVKKTKAYNYKVLNLSTAQNAEVGTIVALFSESDLVSVSENDYLYNAGYKERHIHGLATESRILNPSNQSETLSKSQTVYDEQGQYYSLVDYGSTIGYEVPTGTYANLRGNATTLKVWVKETNTWLDVHSQYDNFGNTRKIWDVSGDSNNFTEIEYASQYYYAYPTKSITPAPDPSGIYATTENSTISTTYDFWTGKILSAIDDYGQTTSIEYDDLLREKKITPPIGGAITEKEYGDTPGNIYVKTRSQVGGQNWSESTSYFDNLGRVYKTKTDDLQGDVYTEVKYDNFGRVEYVSNPYRLGEQKVWSKTRYDDTGRAVENYAPAPEGQVGTSLGIVSYTISHIQNFIGNVITVDDASGRKRRAIINIFGQILRTDEPTSFGGTADADLGNIATPHQASTYKYDLRGNLTEIKQGGQTRTFVYDSFSRIKSATNPESGINNYTYDIRGNLKTKRDARGIKTIYDYDLWGRITNRCYKVIGTGSVGATDCSSASSETAEPNSPDVSFYYDGKGLSNTANFAKGQMTKVSSSISETLYTDFDNFGRVRSHQQITDGHTYSTAYKYNEVGTLIEQTYPSGKIVRNFHNAKGELSSVVSDNKIYASEFSRTSAGAVEKMKLGNGNWETAQFNERFQPTQIGLGNNQTGTNLWKVDYQYGEIEANGNLNPSKNIGNLAKQIITVPGANGESGFTATQTYKYDAVNRLKSAEEKIGGTVNWKQTFNYDIYGNRNFDETNTTTLPKYCVENALPAVCPNDRKTLNPAINLADNRFAEQQGYEYDENGNVIKDSDGRSFIYDALNKQVQVKNISNQIVGNYFYDGESKRIKKTGNNENTIFVYDAFGSLIAEYSLNNPPPNQTASTTYLTSDSLGSPRVVTDQNGNVVSRRDFLPFGEEILSNENNRKAALGYNSGDNLRQKFTGYEKDTETDLEFAQNRYYSNKLGRFTTPDPLMASAKAVDPQTFNRYTYVKNNPLNLVDPNGLMSCDPRKDLNCPIKREKPEIVNIDTTEKPTLIESSIIKLTGTIQPRPVDGDNKKSGCGWNVFCHGKKIVDSIFGGGKNFNGDPTTLPGYPGDTKPGDTKPSDGNAPDPGDDSDKAGGDATSTAAAILLALVKQKIDELLNGKPIKDGYIYRLGGQNPGNLAPRPKDINGLSASSSEPASNQEYIKLDVGKLNAAGLSVVNDRGNHVVIVPKTGKELVEWMAAKQSGAGLNYKYTRAVKEAIVDYNRGR